MLRRVRFGLTLLLLLGGCSYDETLNKVLPKEESAYAQERLEDLRHKRFDVVRAALSPDVVTPDIEARLAQAASFFPAGDPIRIKPIGANIHRSGDRWQANLTYQYYFEDAWAAANILLGRVGSNKVVVQGIRITRLPQPLEEMYAFTVAGKSILHYVFLTLAIAIPLFVLYVLVLCIRAPIGKRKWLWILFVLVGVVAFRLDWTTGATEIQLLHALLFGAGVHRASPYASWVFTLSIPLGAMLFLRKHGSIVARRRRMEIQLASLEQRGKLVATATSEEQGKEVAHAGEIARDSGGYRLRLTERRFGEENESIVVLKSWEELERHLRAETKFVIEDFK